MYERDRHYQYFVTTGMFCCNAILIYKFERKENFIISFYIRIAKLFDPFYQYNTHTCAPIWCDDIYFCCYLYYSLPLLILYVNEIEIIRDGKNMGSRSVLLLCEYINWDRMMLLVKGVSALTNYKYTSLFIFPYHSWFISSIYTFKKFLSLR